MYDNDKCENTPLTIQSSSKCSSVFYVEPKGGNKVDIHYGIKKPQDCIKPPPVSYTETVGECIQSTKSFINVDSNVTIPNGYCSELVQLVEGDCDNFYINSYKDGVCVGPNNGFYQRYTCSGNVVKRYNCSSNCQVESFEPSNNCILDKELKSVTASCPNIKTKNIQDIIKIDGKVDVGGTSSTGGGSSNGNGTNATGSASTGSNGENNTGKDGGDGKNSSNKLNNNISLLSISAIIVLSSFIYCIV